MDLSDPAIIKLTGPPLIFIILTWGLFGVLSVQVYLYSQAFPNDRPTLKTLVYGLYLLEMAQAILLTGTVWRALAKGFGHVEALYEIGTIWLSVCLIGGATAMVVQTFYAYRIFIISETSIIPVFIVLMALVSFIGAIVVAVMTKQSGHLNNLAVHTLKQSIFVGIWTGTSSACDIVIAASMCFYLSKRMRDGFPKTQALISKVMRMSIETGTLTASISIVTLAMYYVPGFENLTYYGVPMSVLAKLYSNTMLALLNSRMKLVIASQSTTWLDNELPQISLSLPQSTDHVKIRFASVNSSETERHIGVERDTITIAEPEEITLSAAV